MSNYHSYHRADRSSSPSTRQPPPADDDIYVDEDLEPLHLEPTERVSPLRTHLIRALALLCACSLSIGSH